MMLFLCADMIDTHFDKAYEPILIYVSRFARRSASRLMPDATRH